MSRNNSQALTKSQRTRQYLSERTETLKQWCTGALDPHALVRFAILSMSQSPKLQKCTEDSIYLALLACAQVGLEPGGVFGDAYIVPYGNTATFQLGYRGMIKLAHRSGYSRLVGNIVYQAELDAGDFDIDTGSELVVRHRPTLSRKPRGEIVGAYALATRRDDGLVAVEWMPWEDLDKVKAHAIRNGASPAWGGWEDQMHRKSPIRRMSKRMDLTRQAALAVQLDGLGLSDRNDIRGVLEAEANEIIDVDEAPPTTGVAGVKAKIDDKKPPAAAA